ncbi:DCC1-like thiol-disulfide oxidoreductase family protein [Microbulbifer sp. OS29]|uniref:DCC1-like thiol-disulfide oxidoreductase family protein n=1 Tax=Microbulbifer okhotskensis TaxID=2926617 RepID=A0A9X2J569_9GAMM|nr:DCC1-like thiol-disulfide oxidoreductase family protein [Microbulbifer okhotskensis]MCO1333270.1 DCC1-like thiol-disulfide oxidoreductase family protein [Microbulbifer okhotskensis]
MTMPSSTPPNIVLFDSLCHLCNGWSRLLLNCDREHFFALCRVQSPAGLYYLERLNLPLDTYETMILLERHGDNFQQFTKSEAALKIASHLSGPWRLLTVLRYIPRPIRDWFYDLVARNRYRWFGRRNRCLLPNEDDKQRFLEDVPEEIPDEPV